MPNISHSKWRAPRRSPVAFGTSELTFWHFLASDFTGSESCADELGVGTHGANLMLHLTKYAKIYAAKVATNGFFS